MSQLNIPTKGDWVTQVLIDMNDLQLNTPIEQVEKMSKMAFKDFVKEKVYFFHLTI